MAANGTFRELSVFFAATEVRSLGKDDPILSNFSSHAA
jgi:hypothetical protein